MESVEVVSRNGSTTTDVKETTIFNKEYCGMLYSKMEELRKHLDLGKDNYLDLEKDVNQVHVTTLDEVVSVNSAFTVAVFLGLSLTPPSQTTQSSTSLGPQKSSCFVGIDTYRYLMLFEVISFSCFLFSSLVAHGIKLFIVLGNSKDRPNSQTAKINPTLLRLGILISAVGSILGTIFLTLSMVNLVQVRLGSLTCGNPWSTRAAIPVVTMVGGGATIFISAVFYAFRH